MPPLQHRPLRRVIELLNDYAFEITQQKLVDDLRTRFGYYNVEILNDDIIVKLGYESTHEFYVNNKYYVEEESNSRGFSIYDKDVVEINDFIVVSPMPNFDFSSQFIPREQFGNNQDYKNYIIDELKSIL
jgi:hypothetical protein